MAKVTNPTTFSRHFNLDERRLDRLGILDPTLAIDTSLFIDPLLFPKSRVPEIRRQAVREYRAHFEKVIQLLVASQQRDDPAWKAARRLLQFHEIPGTCLGYGASSIRGSGFGPRLTERVLIVGKEVVDLGIRDPDLFPALALFEEDIGPDRISDMATNVAIDAFIALNGRLLDEFQLRGDEFDVRGHRGRFLTNPFQQEHTPIILVPIDVLRDLPIARDWDGVASAASHNESLRARVNEHVGHIWAAKRKRDRRELREQALASSRAFQTLLDAIHGVPTLPYNADADPAGLHRWAPVAASFAANYPLALEPARPLDLDGVHDLVRKIVAQFRQLVEQNGLNRELYEPGGKPRHESSAQRLFFAIAHAYCKANNVDVSPEVDAGNGQVDFKFSTGFNSRVLVEVKLSTNTKLLDGFTAQLEAYKQSEETMRAIYLVVDVGRMGQKDQRLIKLRNDAAARGEPPSDLEFVDGLLKPPASKRRGG